MTRQIVAITGVSGVGKSTLIEKIAMSVSLEHLRASALIKEGRDASNNVSIRQDQLRNLDIDENQRFLIRGFQLRSRGCAGLIILDSHTVIEKNDSLARIDACVFGTIGIDRMIFLEDDPAAIATRRQNDSLRNRPVPEVGSLKIVQEKARDQATAICQELKVPLHLSRPSPIEIIARLIQFPRRENE